MKKKFSLLILLSLTFAAHACSCRFNPEQGFVDGTKPTHIIVHAKVLRYAEPLGDENATTATGKKVNVMHFAMDISINYVLQGEFHSSEARVFGDNGRLCRPYVHKFPIGTEWIFNLFAPQTGSALALSDCGVYWLPVEGGMVEGQIVGTARTKISVEKLKALLDNKAIQDSSSTRIP